MKSPYWHQALSPQPYNPYLLRFAAIPSLQDSAIFVSLHRRVHSSGHSSGGPLCSSRQQGAQKTVYLLYAHAPTQSFPLVFVSSPWSSQAVSHSRTIPAQLLNFSAQMGSCVQHGMVRSIIYPSLLMPYISFGQTKRLTHDAMTMSSQEAKVWW